MAQPVDSEYMELSAIALQGLQQAESQLNATASTITNASTTRSDGSSLDEVDLSAEMVALMSAQIAFSANLATLKTADQMQKSLVDIKS